MSRTKISLDQIKKSDLNESEMFRCSYNRTHLVEDPIICQDCDQMVCESCYLNNYKCPNCSCTINRLKTDFPPFLMPILNQITLKCENWVKGCPEEITYENYRVHTNNCKFIKFCQTSKEDVFSEDIKKEVDNVGDGNRILIANLDKPNKLAHFFREESLFTNQDKNQNEDDFFWAINDKKDIPKNQSNNNNNFFLKKEDSIGENQTEPKKFINYFKDSSLELKDKPNVFIEKEFLEEKQYKAKDLINYYKAPSNPKSPPPNGNQIISEKNNALVQNKKPSIENKNSDGVNKKNNMEAPKKKLHQEAEKAPHQEQEEMSLEDIKTLIVKKVIGSEKIDDLLKVLKHQVSKLEKQHYVPKNSDPQKPPSSQSILRNLPDKILFNFTDSDFQILTIDHLKALLDNRNLKKGGNKDDLILKLKVYIMDKQAELEKKREKEKEKKDIPEVEKKIKKINQVRSHKISEFLRNLIKKDSTNVRKDLLNKINEEKHK